MTLAKSDAVQLLDKLREIEFLLEEELSRQACEKPEVVRIKQALAILHQVRLMQRQVESPPLPLLAQRASGMGRIVADSWSIESKLGGLIISAEKEYLNFN